MKKIPEYKSTHCIRPPVLRPARTSTWSWAFGSPSRCPPRIAACFSSRQTLACPPRIPPQPHRPRRQCGLRWTRSQFCVVKKYKQKKTFDWKLSTMESEWTYRSFSFFFSSSTSALLSFTLKPSISAGSTFFFCAFFSAIISSAKNSTSSLSPENNNHVFIKLY